jgi:hypothetical protein
MSGTYFSGGVCVVAPIGMYLFSEFDSPVVTNALEGKFVGRIGASAYANCSASLLSGAAVCQATQGMLKIVNDIFAFP